MSVLSTEESNRTINGLPLPLSLCVIQFRAFQKQVESWENEFNHLRWMGAGALGRE